MSLLQTKFRLITSVQSGQNWPPLNDNVQQDQRAVGPFVLAWNSGSYG